MPKRNKKGSERGRVRTIQQYKVVQQSYEDKDYEGTQPKPVLVPVAQLNKAKRPKFDMPEFAPLPEDFTEKRNMLMMNDEGGDGEGDNLFEDEVEEDFDIDFIKQMMTQGGTTVDEEEEELDEGAQAEKRRAARHDPASHGALERQFQRMLHDFADDEDLDEEDPRVQGPLDPMTYAEAFNQFMEENAGQCMADVDEGLAPMKHRGFINQLKKLSRANNIFDSNAKGYFYALLPDKIGRMKEQFVKDHEGLRMLTLQRINEGVIDTTDVLHQPDLLQRPQPAQPTDSDGEADDVHRDNHNRPTGLHVVEVCNKKDRMDCETILSTYSTLYNHPNIIAAQKKKLDLAKARARGAVKAATVPSSSSCAPAATATSPMGAPVVVVGKIKQKEEQPAQEGAGDAEEAEAAGPQSYQEALQIGIDLSHRPAEESAEEKKLRRKMAKQIQASRRAQKKEVREMYASAAVGQKSFTRQSQTDKAQMQLSLVKAVPQG